MAPEKDVEPDTSIDTVDGKLDLEAVVARFAGDDSRISHALPASLSSEQRQLAKKLVGQNEGLECESYGFGPERQLHIFKKGRGCNGVRTRVKNTFIDAWLEGGEGKFGLGNHPVFRSLPSDWRSAVVAALVAPVAGELELESTKDDDYDMIHVCATPSPCNTPMLPGFPTLPSLAEAHDPNGTEFMSSQVGAQLSVQGTAPSFDARHKLSPLQNRPLTPPPPAMPPPASPCNVAMLAQGTHVEIDGLVARPDFNGLCGMVQSWDPMLRRYNVLLDNAGMGGPRYVKTKRENLKIGPPPPPPSTADPSTTIRLDCCILLDSEDAFQNGNPEQATVDAASWSPSISANSQGCYSLQYSDTPVSTQCTYDQWTGLEDDGSMSPNNVDMFSGSEANWDYMNNTSVTGVTFNEAIQSFETVESSSWLLGSSCMEQSVWAR